MTHINRQPADATARNADKNELGEPEMDAVIGGVTFEYGSIQVTYTRQNDTGAAQGTVATTSK